MLLRAAAGEHQHQRKAAGDLHHLQEHLVVRRAVEEHLAGGQLEDGARRAPDVDREAILLSSRPLLRSFKDI